MTSSSKAPAQLPSNTDNTGLRWWPRRFTRLPLALEIALALLIKLLILGLLWKCFFSHPPAKHMRMPLPQVEQHLLGSTESANPPATLPIPPRSTISETTTKAEHELDR